MSKRATFFITSTAAIGMLVLAHSLWYWHSSDLTRFICYLLIATLASGLKIQLPGIDGTMSVNFLFILLGVLEMSMSGDPRHRLHRKPGAVRVVGAEQTRSR